MPITLDIILNIGSAVVNRTDKILTLMEPTCSRREGHQTRKQINEAVLQDDGKDGVSLGEVLVYPVLQRGQV